MRSRVGKLSAFVLCLSIACTVPQLLAKKKEKAEPGTNDQKRAVHALNRLTFGPRPGDVQQVMAIGVDRWIDEQLHPEKISDSNLDARLAPLRTLHMSTKELREEFPDQQTIKQVMDGKRSMPSDPARRAVYEVQIARLQDKQERRDRKEPAITPAQAPASPAASDGAKTAEELAAAAAASPDATPNADGNNMNAANSANSDVPANMSASEMSMNPPAETKMTPEEEAEARRREDRLYADLKVQSLVDLPPDERYKKVIQMSAQERLAFADSMRGPKGIEFVADMNPRQRETLLAMNNPGSVLIQELSEAKLLHAIYGERQLEEVMTDFWFNHFNVFVGKGPERLLLSNYENEVIRPRALGKFEDLLVATAKSPAMLFYLDNWMSVGPNSMQAQGIPARTMRYGPYGRQRPYPNQNPNARRRQNNGLNENYGRELLELHTLSVNGGYSQRD